MQLIVLPMMSTKQPTYLAYLLLFSPGSGAFGLPIDGVYHKPACKLPDIVADTHNVVVSSNTYGMVFDDAGQPMLLTRCVFDTRGTHAYTQEIGATISCTVVPVQVQRITTLGVKHKQKYFRRIFEKFYL